MQHPRKCDLRAYADGEGSLAWRAEQLGHQLRCTTCQRQVQQFATEREEVRSALESLQFEPWDVASSWARLQVRAGRAVPQHAPRTARWSWSSAGIGALAAAAALLLAAPLVRPSPLAPAVVSAPPTAADALVRVQQLVIGRETAFAPTADEQQLVTAALFALRRSAGTDARNVCCGDHDAGGPSDDGLLTLNRPGQDVATVVIYEDVDASGDLSSGDLIRFVSQRATLESNEAAVPVLMAPGRPRA